MAAAPALPDLLDACSPAAVKAALLAYGAECGDASKEQLARCIVAAMEDEKARERKPRKKELRRMRQAELLKREAETARRREGQGGVLGMLGAVVAPPSPPDARPEAPPPAESDAPPHCAPPPSQPAPPTDLEREDTEEPSLFRSLWNVVAPPPAV